ncbi:MAG: hypothetical protein PUD59_00700, partial [bacterium]|nr:hypothetical protein [bacterium]
FDSAYCHVCNEKKRTFLCGPAYTARFRRNFPAHLPNSRKPPNESIIRRFFVFIFLFSAVFIPF